MKTALIALAVAALPFAAMAQNTSQGASQTSDQTRSLNGAPGARLATGPATSPTNGRASDPAAATLPNAFGETPARSAARPVAAPSTAAPASATVTAAEAALRTTILAIQSGTPNYDAMTPDVATRLREHSTTLVPLIQGFGELQAGVHAGTQNGAELFAVAFDNAATEWIIALDAQGKIAALLFRPAAVVPADETR